MNSRRIAVAVAAALALPLYSAATHAQEFRSKPPTQADWSAMAKLPDLTGVWEAVTVGGGNRAGRAGARAGGAARGGVAGRAGGPPAQPQLTPEYAQKRQEIVARHAEDNDTANCLPPGMPGIMGQPYPYEFLLTPGKVTIIGEAYMQVRHIYTDGRKLPDDPDPTFNGTSIGHWEGDTLVIQSVGFSTQTTMAANTPHSDKMQIVERVRLTAPDVMTIDTTVTDPEALTAPWVTTRTLARHREWTTAEYICEQNNRNYVDSQGKAGIKLGPPSQKE